MIYRVGNITNVESKSYIREIYPNPTNDIIKINTNFVANNSTIFIL